MVLYVIVITSMMPFNNGLQYCLLSLRCMPLLQDIRVSNKYSPWLNSDFRTLSRERDRIKTVAVNRKSAILMDAYKQLRHNTNILNKNLKREYFSKKLAACKGDIKQSWKTINLLSNKRSI